jgi:hypothetical protein
LVVKWERDGDTEGRMVVKTGGRFVVKRERMEIAEGGGRECADERLTACERLQARGFVRAATCESGQARRYWRETGERVRTRDFQGHNTG